MSAPIDGEVDGAVGRGTDSPTPPATYGAPLRHLMRAVALALVPVLAALPGLGSLGSHHGDETNYMQVALHMMHTGNYLVPVYHGRLVLDRAPLFYWLEALSFRTFGISVIAARLPSLLALGLIVALIYWFTLRAYGRVRDATYAALAMGSPPVVEWLCRLAVPDMVMTLGVLLAVGFYHQATVSAARRLSLLAASSGLGLAGMAKGHVGIVVASLPLVVFTVVDRRSPRAVRLRDLAAPWSWMPALMLSTWWYVFLLASGSAVIEFAPGHPDPHQTLGGALLAFLRAEAEHQIQGGWLGLGTNLRMYAMGLVAWFLPWSVYVIAGFFFGPRLLRVEWRQNPRLTAGLVLVIAAITALFAFFILEVRSARYLLPVTPAVAILAARYWVRRETLSPRLERIPRPVILAVGMLALFTLLFGVLLPAAVRPPIENLCSTVRSRLSPSDTVLAAGLGDKWSTFATVMLGRRVTELPQGTDPWPLVASHVTARQRGRGFLYVLTTPRLAEPLMHEHPNQLRLIAHGRGGWLAERRALWEGAAMLEVVEVAPDAAP
jgi:4-amino-4-deoxy-L-arabinose transferase-like glycosyltransferase